MISNTGTGFKVKCLRRARRESNGAMVGTARRYTLETQEMTATEVERQGDRIEILGVPVDRVTMAEATSRIEEFVTAGVPRIVVTADSSGVVRAQGDPEFLAILRRADLVTPDSVGILWAARRKGVALPERVCGVDLADRICALSAQRGYRVFLLGAAPGVAEMAAEKMRLRHPGCNIVGTRHGYFPEDSDEIVAQEIARAKPDVLIVGMGIPRQEKFIASTQTIVRAPVAIGVGGSLDVFSGKAKRAPRWVQRLGLEWLWRTVLNPRKIAKAKALPRFVWLVLRSRR